MWDCPQDLAHMCADKKNLVVLIGGSGFIGNQVDLDLKNDVNYKVISTSTKNNDKYFQLDLSDSQSIKIFLDKLKNFNFEKVTVVFLSAYKNTDLAINLNENDLIKSFQVNVFGPHSIVKSMLPYMIEKKWGRFIFISSSKAINGDIGMSAYASSKNSIIAYSKILGIEYGRFNITSNVLSLGYFNGPLWNEIDETKRIELIKNVPSKKLGKISDISESIKLLINTNYINCSIINIDGGLF